jgi:hypothetical protein
MARNLKRLKSSRFLFLFALYIFLGCYFSLLESSSGFASFYPTYPAAIPIHAWMPLVKRPMFFCGLDPVFSQFGRICTQTTAKVQRQSHQ